MLTRHQKFVRRALLCAAAAAVVLIPFADYWGRKIALSQGAFGVFYDELGRCTDKVTGPTMYGRYVRAETTRGTFRPDTGAVVRESAKLDPEFMSALTCVQANRSITVEWSNQ